MQRILARKYKGNHTCTTKLAPIAVGKTPKKRDDLIYTLVEGFYSLFRVEEILDNEEYYCRQFNIIDKMFPVCPGLNFGLVGVFKNHGFKSGMKIVRENEVKGKVILNQGTLFTVSKNVRAEK